jgi:hypothetical protein
MLIDITEQSSVNLIEDNGRFFMKAADTMVAWGAESVPETWTAVNATLSVESVSSYGNMNKVVTGAGIDPLVGSWASTIVLASMNLDGITFQSPSQAKLTQGQYNRLTFNFYRDGGGPAVYYSIESNPADGAVSVLVRGTSPIATGLTPVTVDFFLPLGWNSIVVKIGNLLSNSTFYFKDVVLKGVAPTLSSDVPDSRTGNYTGFLYWKRPDPAAVTHYVKKVFCNDPYGGYRECAYLQPGSQAGENVVTLTYPYDPSDPNWVNRWKGRVFHFHCWVNAPYITCTRLRTSAEVPYTTGGPGVPATLWDDSPWYWGPAGTWQRIQISAKVPDIATTFSIGIYSMYSVPTLIYAPTLLDLSWGASTKPVPNAFFIPPLTLPHCIDDTVTSFQETIDVRGETQGLIPWDATAYLILVKGKHTTATSTAILTFGGILVLNTPTNTSSNYAQGWVKSNDGKITIVGNMAGTYNYTLQVVGFMM